MKKPLFIVFGLLLVMSKLSYAQIADPAVSNIQITQNNTCLDSNEIVTVTINNLGGTVDLGLHPITVQLEVIGPNGSQTYSEVANSGLLTNTATNFVFLNNINLYNGGCYSLNTSFITTGSNSNLSNDSLSSPYVICNSRPQNVDYNLCLGNSIPNGQGLKLSNCNVKDSVLIPFTLNFAGNTPPNPTQCAATGSGFFAAATLPSLPTGANILSGEINVNNLQLAPPSFTTNPSLTRFSLFDGNVVPPLAPANIYHNGLVGNPLSTVPFGCFNYLSILGSTDLNSIYNNNGVPVPAGGNLNMGHWSTNRCTATNIIANCGSPTVATLKIVYEYPPSSLRWYEQASGGVSISNASVFDPLQTPNSIISNSNSAGTYTFYGACPTDTNCRVATNLTVFGFQIDTTSVSNILCKGDSSGIVVLNSIGGYGQTQYSISPNIGIQTSGGTFASLPAGIYTAVGTDGNGCTASKTFTITEPATAVQITNVTSTIPSCVPGCDGSMTITASGGTGFLLYRINSNPVGQASNLFTGICGGAYPVSIMDANGCVDDSTAIILNPGAPTINSVIVNNVSCNGGNDGSVQVSASGGAGALYFSMTPVATQNPGGVFNGLSAGVYVISLTDANNCSIQTQVVINEPPAISLNATSISNPTCNQSNGSISVLAIGGTGTNFYSINSIPPTINSTGNFNNLPAGSYTITATDGNACIGTTTVNLSNSFALAQSNIMATDVLCYGDSSGSITVYSNNPNGPITYSIGAPFTIPNNTTGQFINLPANTYSIIATDANNCSAAATTTIYEPQLLTLNNSSVINVKCNGDSNGSIQINAPGGTSPYSYTILPIVPPTLPITNNLPAGSYSLQIADANGCFASKQFTIIEPPVLNLQSEARNSACFPPNSGNILSGATGGSPPYSYAVNNTQQTSPNFYSLSPGNYIHKVIDANGCIDSSLLEVKQHFIHLDSVIASPKNCMLGNNGCVIAYYEQLVSDTVEIYSSQSTFVYKGNKLSTLDSGTAMIYIWDQHTSCRDSSTVSIPYELKDYDLDSTIVSNASCIQNSDGALEVYDTASSPNFSYSLIHDTDTLLGNSHNNLFAKEYIVMGINNQGCIGRDTVSVSVLDNREFFYTTTKASNVHCYGSINAEATGGIGEYTYSIHPNSGRQTEHGYFDGLCWGNYILTSTDSVGCKLQEQFKIIEDLDAPFNLFHHFSVFPNPANDKIWLKSDYLFEYKVSIINALGQCLSKKDCHDKITSLDVDHLSPGVYILKFKSQIDYFERKIVIQR